MSDKPSTPDRAPDAQASEAEQPSEHERQMITALDTFVFGAWNQRGDAAIAFLRAWREAVREQVTDIVGAREARHVSEWHTPVRDNAPQPAAPDETELRDHVVELLLAWMRNAMLEDGSLDYAPEKGAVATSDRIIALVRQHDAQREFDDMTAYAQPAPVATGDEESLALVALLIRQHYGGSKDDPWSAGLAREIHAHYERRAAQQREALIDAGGQLYMIASALDKAVACAAWDAALAKHEQGTKGTS